jgi:endonuclease/exonuclease/phosphatase family metal-dependent hydrolase
MLRIFSALIFLMLSVAAVEARPLRFATWNLGWHLSLAEANTWIAKCDAPFAKDPQTGVWKPAASGTPGWKLTWGRDAKIEWDLSVLPPCDVFGDFDAIPATATAYANRSQRIQNVIRDEIDPDIIAFQEVSGEQAVRDVLPGGGDEYFICSFTGFKVQRLAIAWRKTLGPALACEVEPSLSLPALPVAEQPRPGLSLLLNVDGKPLRVFAVHLKSSCVSPLEGSNGDLAGAADACLVLQRQVAPLEAWIEAKTTDARFVVLGDFNRNLWHERVDRTPVRSDGSDTREPLLPGVKVSSLIEEIDDTRPFNRQFVLLHERCPQNGFTEGVCEAGQFIGLTRAETTMLSYQENLGCSFAFGLDHILVGTGLRVEEGALKIALGSEGKSLEPSPPAFPDPRLAVSDHCPTVATVLTN